jgi:23S rRNA (cytosine1962-C5)-methyltransferase
MNPEALATLHDHLLTALAAAPAETRRLFHGRGRCWPGLEQLTVDWLQGVVLVSLFKEPEAAQLEAFEAIADGYHASHRVGSNPARTPCCFNIVTCCKAPPNGCSAKKSMR